MVDSGLTAVRSGSLTDEWRTPGQVPPAPGALDAGSSRLVVERGQRLRVERDYQNVVNEMRAVLAAGARWVERVELIDTPPEQDGQLRADPFQELASPLIAGIRVCFDRLEAEAARIDPELAPAHRAFAQAALHPLILGAPFVHRTFTKPLGYAGDYQMVNQILGDPRQGPDTFSRIVNAAFLQAPVAVAHRNRIDILLDFLVALADRAREAGRPFRVLNVGCGPAAEVQRFLSTYPEPHWLSFELLDFSEETLDWTAAQLAAITAGNGKTASMSYVQSSVRQLLERSGVQDQAREFDAVYCAGLFDYLSDRVCARFMAHFASRIRAGGKLLVTNVHPDNPGKYVMEHLLEWHLIYRDEARLGALLPEQAGERSVFLDATGVNLFAELSIA